MDALRIEKLESLDEVTLQLSGRVELSHVPQVMSCLSGLGSRRLVLDFSRGEVTSDATLGALVETAPARQLVCRGLRSHQDRIIGYLKVGGLVA
jgi:hypothetical protein